MVVKVGNINNIAFRSQIPVTKPVYDNSDEIKITELQTATPDFGVQAPQKYSKLGTTSLENGLQIHSYKLANGHRVTVIPMEGSPATVKNYVNVGSMNETDDIKGISHFLEHMAFNGTNGSDGYIKLERGDSFKKVDELGGWTNASTNYSLTDYVNSAPLLEDKDLEQQIKIIAAMTEDLALSSDMVEKEKFPVCSEIDMILDNPETIAIDQTVRSLFNVRSSADELVGGSVNHIQNLDRQKVLDYYNKYYTPDNMHLVITGDVDPNEVMGIVSKNFHSNKVSQGKKYDEKLTPIKEIVRKDFITDKASSTTVVLGFAGPKSNDAKSKIIGNIVDSYLHSGEFNIDRMLEICGITAPGFGNEKISTNPNNPTFNYYEFTSSEEDVEAALRIVFHKFSDIKIKDVKTLENIKQTLKMDFNNTIESSSFLNNVAGKSAFDGNLDYITNFNSILDSITLEDVNDYIKKYLDISKAALTVVHPETSPSDIFLRHDISKSLTFEGKSRIPVNMNKVSETTLDNNYKLAFTESKNNNVPYSMELIFDVPKNVNPAAFVVLNRLLSQGTMDKTPAEFDKYMEDNNFSVSASLDEYSLSISGYSAENNFEKTTQTMLELLNNPRFTQEEFDKAIEYLKNIYSRHDNSSWDLYEGYEAKNNPHYASVKEITNGLDKVTLEDVKNLYNYIMANSKGIITVNIPETSASMKARAVNEFSKLGNVKPFEYKQEQLYEEIQKPVVLTEARNVSQAEIRQTYKFPTDNSMKDRITRILVTSILSSSDTIGLFNSLRERDHLAYRVNASSNNTGNCGEEHLFILTSTDNKDTGTTSYDNVQKAINGFNRQIGMLLNSEYKDSDLETAKRGLKAQILDKESVGSRIITIMNALRFDETLDYDNRAFEMIDSITREDIDNYAKKVFANAPVYSIIASQDTLDYNKEFLDNLTR